ncbi:MAG: hypothetical protein U1E45_18625 [Geminicoccaceae bacterium]
MDKDASATATLVRSLDRQLDAQGMRSALVEERLAGFPDALALATLFARRIDG